MKALKSKMLMCDVAYEREAQKALKDRKNQMHSEINQHWEELEQQKQEEYDAKMREKLESDYHKKQENSKAISDQLDEFKLNYIKQLKEEMLEGELIKRQVEEDLEREKVRELQRQKKMHGIKEDIAKANRDQIKQQELEHRKELAEEERIEKFTKHRLDMDNQRKEREETRFKDKLSNRQTMIDKQIE